MKRLGKLLYVIAGAWLIAYAAWYFGSEIGLSGREIVHLAFAIYFVCVGQIYLAKFHEKDDDK